MQIIFAGITFFSTLLGGLFGIRHRNKLPLILSFAAGVILSVVSFDVFPEMIGLIEKIGIDPKRPLVLFAIGFFVFHSIEKLIQLHPQESDQKSNSTKVPVIGKLSALALSTHSFMDGVGIGLGFQVSVHIGIFVSLAVIAHDFTDGLNTVSLMLINKNSSRSALWYLLIDAIAPVLGALSTLFFTLSENILVLYLGFFSGFLLYIGASEILPEAYREKSSRLNLLMTLIGVVFMYCVSLGLSFIK